MNDIPMWAKSMSSESCFQDEQAQLGSVWTFLGFQHQLMQDNDWFVARLGGRLVIVQRFSEGLRAFENLCPHRFHPIRTADQGNGPMVCAFHQWRFDAEGCARGIPKCEQVFGKTARQMNASLHKVELALCGGLIFGRFGAGPTLEEWLGQGYAILERLTANLQKGGRIELSVKSHWKPMMAVTLDDYHIVAVHPSTFGKSGFLPADRVRYYRFGEHSAFIPSGDSETLNKVEAACRENRFSPQGYMIFQFFPTFVFVVIRATRILGDDYWYVMTEQMIPHTHDRTTLRTHFFPLPFPRPAGLFRRIVRWFFQPIVNIVFAHFTRKVHREDNAVCENAQHVAHQIQGEMLLSNQEERIAWFEESYGRYVRFSDAEE